MHIGEALQLLARRPVGQVRHREMHHHRAGAEANFFAGPVVARVAAPPGSRCCDSACGVTPAITARFAPIVSPLASRMPMARPPRAVPPPPRIEMQRAAERFEPRDHRLDHRVGAARADHHAESLVGHAFEIGEERAARDVGRKIEMHAPRGERRADLRRLEIPLEEFARRGDEQPRGLEHPAGALRAPCLPGVRARARAVIGEPSRPKMCGASAPNFSSIAPRSLHPHAKISRRGRPSSRGPSRRRTSVRRASARRSNARPARRRGRAREALRHAPPGRASRRRG